MCLIVFSLRQNKKYPFILATNRDEFYDRPARPAQFWNSHRELLAGKDLKGGGTWLGITKQGRFAALTNYRDLTDIKEDAPSRGDIVKNFLTGRRSAPAYLDRLDKGADMYNGFNLLSGSPEQLFHYDNVTRDITEIPDGIHAISNAILNTPWPKVEQAKSDLQDVISGGELSIEKLFTLLQNKKTYPLKKLPETGLSEEMEKAVSAAFIKTENYGTRCSTVLLMDEHGEATFIERTYLKGDLEQVEEKSYQFQLSSED